MSFQKIIIPVIMGAHWWLIVVDTRKKEIKSYDSMLLDDESCIHNVRKLILSLRF